jgi:phosphatidylinositol glycan class N
MILESKRRTEIAFSPFGPLKGHLSTDMLDKIEQQIATGDFTLAKQAAVDLIQLCLQGLRYYQTYPFSLLFI